MDAWTLVACTFGLCTPARLNSGRLEAWTLEAWTLNTWILKDWALVLSTSILWTLGFHMRITKVHAYYIDSIGSNVAIFKNSILTLRVTLQKNTE